MVPVAGNIKRARRRAHPQNRHQAVPLEYALRAASSFHSRRTAQGSGVRSLGVNHQLFMELFMK